MNSSLEKKKAAICLSGGIKNGEKCIESIQKLSCKLDLKIFIHTWKIDNLQDFCANHSWSGVSEDSKVGIAEILKSLNVETLKLERFESLRDTFMRIYESHDFIKTDSKPTGALSMYYSIFQSNRLLINYCQSTKENFDLVVRMRFDSDIKNPEVLIEQVIEEKKIYIPDGSNWNGINDQFAYGSLESMNVYSSLFANLNHLKNTPYYPEALLRNYLNLTNFPVQRTPLVVNINGR
jgi:hypothetical protein